MCIFFFAETVINAPIEGSEQDQANEQTSQNAQIQQFKLAEIVDDEEITSGDKLLDNETVLPTNENCNYYEYAEDEQNLMPTSVYQKTCEIVEKTKRIQPSTLGSLASLESVEKLRSVNCRTVLWYVTFVGFMVNYVYRININIAIVEMVSMGKVHASIPSVTNTSKDGLLQTFNSTAIKVDDVSTVVQLCKFCT